MTEPGMSVRKRFEKIKAEHGKVIQPEPTIGFLISLVEEYRSLAIENFYDVWQHSSDSKEAKKAAEIVEQAIEARMKEAATVKVQIVHKMDSFCSAVCGENKPNSMCTNWEYVTCKDCLRRRGKKA